MAFIDYVRSDTLAPEDRVADPDNIIQIHGVHPAVMRQHYELYKELMHRDGPLSRRERELLGVRVSAINQCHYWLHHHGAGLRAILIKDAVDAGQREAIVAGLQTTPISAPHLVEREAALLAYADVLTLTPATVTRAHIAALRSAGCDDRAIHDACAIIGYFAFVNRIADGRGVQLEGHPSAE